MKKVLAAVVLSLSFVACAVDTVPEPEGTATSALQEASPAIESSGGEATPLAACTQVWECELCRNGVPRNILYQECDDGARTVIFASACGVECL